MAFTHANALDQFGTTRLIVATSAANGSHTTLASALADASVGETVFLRDSVTENVTLPPGVNIAAWTGGTLNTPSITGTVTMTGAGTSNISGIRLVTNSAFAIAVTGSAASILNLNNCYINCTNNTGISYTTSSSSAAINISNCSGNLGTTGIGLFTSSSPGVFFIQNCHFTNTGNSLTSSTTSATLVEIINSELEMAFTTSSSGVFTFRHTTWNKSLNITLVTTAGTGGATLQFCVVTGGTASAISIGTGTVVALESVSIDSSNANAITGTGNLRISRVDFTNTSSVVNPTLTVTQYTSYPLNVPSGGTSAVTLTGIMTGNGTGAVTANAVTNHGVLLGGASNAASSLAVAATGTVLTGVTGADPAFSATPAVTSITLSSGTALSTYVENTWTPTITFGNLNVGITYTTQTGLYTMIGNVVYIYGLILLSNKGSSTGAFRMTSLPFTVKNTSTYTPPIAVAVANITLAATDTFIYAQLPQGTTTCTVIQVIPATGVAASITDANFANNSQIAISGWYTV